MFIALFEQSKIITPLVQYTEGELRIFPENFGLLWTVIVY
jgi:hypothetical protein